MNVHARTGVGAFTLALCILGFGCESTVSSPGKRETAGGMAGAESNEGGTGGDSTTGSGGLGGAPVGSGGTSQSGGASQSGGTGGDPPLDCGTQVDCGGNCVDIATSPEHCGRCEHTCGGGECSKGRCQPMVVHALEQGTVDALGVGDTNVYFSTTVDDTTHPLLSCPKTGCTLAPRQLDSRYWGIEAIAHANDTVVFLSAPTQSTYRPALYACPESGCNNPSSVHSQGLSGYEYRLVAQGSSVWFDGFQSGLGWIDCANGEATVGGTLGVKGTHGSDASASEVFFVSSASSGSQPARCDKADGPCTPTLLDDGDWGDVSELQEYDGKLYFVWPGREDFFEGQLRVCNLDDGCASPVELADGLDWNTWLHVDFSGIYWLRKSDHRFQRCSLDDCQGGAQDWFTPTGIPTWPQADEDFVYWAQGATVYRIAK